MCRECDEGNYELLRPSTQMYVNNFVNLSPFKEEKLDTRKTHPGQCVVILDFIGAMPFPYAIIKL